VRELPAATVVELHVERVATVVVGRDQGEAALEQRALVDGEEPGEFHSVADYTAETAEANPDWQIDLCDEVVGTWRGEQGKAAAMTLVWGRPLVDGGVVVTGELADLAVDQCPLLEGRFTLLAPDDYRGDTLDVKVFDRRGSELAHESLYTEDDQGDEDA